MKFSIGCNYWASNAGMRMWRDWDPDCVVADLDALAAHGVSALRVFPLWPDFQPLTRLDGGSGWHRGFAQNDGPFENEAGVSSEMMQHFRFLCDEAGKRGISLVVSLITGWMSGRLFVPSGLNGMNTLTDAAAIEWEVKFVRHFVGAMRDHPAIVAWDLGNECNCMFSRRGTTSDRLTRADAWTWMNAIASAIRLADGSRPVVSGMHSCSSDIYAPWNLRDVGELLDILTTHPYPPFVPLCNREPFDSFRNALHPVAESLYYAGVSGKPCFVEEAGSLGPNYASDAKAARMLRLGAFSSRVYGIGGYLWWCAFDFGRLDFPPYDWCAVERELGLFTDDRKPKETAVAMRELRGEVAALDALPPRKVDAVCLVSQWDDSWPQSFGAFLLATQAGISIDFAPAEGEWPACKMFILPSPHGRGEYSRRAWDRLRRIVAEGASLLLSRGGACYSDFAETTGCRVESMYDEPWQSEVFLVEGDRRPIRLSSETTTVISVERARVLATDAKGNPFMTVSDFGKGRVAFVNCELERIAAMRHDCFSEDNLNPAYLLYSAAADALGFSRLCPAKPPLVSLTEHRDGNGTIVRVGVNYSHADVTVPFAIPAGGFSIKQ